MVSHTTSCVQASLITISITFMWVKGLKSTRQLFRLHRLKMTFFWCLWWCLEQADDLKCVKCWENPQDALKLGFNCINCIHIIWLYIFRYGKNNQILMSSWTYYNIEINLFDWLKKKSLLIYLIFKERKQFTRVLQKYA